MTKMCPHCGYNLTADRDLICGPWRLTPTWITLNGKPLPVTPSQAAILHTIARAARRPITAEVICNRVSDAKNPVNLVAVQICRLRKQFGDMLPVETVRGRGYRWTGPAPAEATPQP